MALDALGMLDKYSSAFDIKKYNDNKKQILKDLARHYSCDSFANDNYDLCIQNGFNMPSVRTCDILRAIKKIVLYPLRL